MPKSSKPGFSLTNWGNKDDHGRQVRIEHRTRYTRVSRTNGAAIRAQAKAVGINLTVNSSHGIRLSKGIIKGTQVALQNGHLRLRGRYGDGPTKLNLSNSGVTVSTRNQLGTFNWLKPQRSSAKLFGVQVRGKKAAQLHLVYGLLVLLYQALSFIFTTTFVLLKLLLALLQALYRGGQKLYYSAWQAISARVDARYQQGLAQALAEAEHLPAEQVAALQQWSLQQHQAAILWILAAWGKGTSELELVALWQAETTTSSVVTPALRDTLLALPEIAAILNRYSEDFATAAPMYDELRLLTWLAQQLPKNQASLDWLLDLDEWLLHIQAGRSKLQTRMYERLLACLAVGTEA